MELWKFSYITALDKNALSMLLLGALQAIFMVADLLLNFVCGYTIKKGFKKEREMAKKYKHSAQEVKILYRGTYGIFYSMNLENYLYYHVKYTSPKVILENDNIILSGMTPTHAYFSMTSNEDDVLNIDTCPFLCVGQFLRSKRLVIITMEAFHQLANDLGHPNDRDVIILGNAGRCGSNLLCQMMNKVPGVRTLSEPWVLVHAYQHYKEDRFTLKQLRSVVKSAVILQCKPEHSSITRRKLFIKLPFSCIYLHPIIKEMFSKFKFIFMTRHSKDILTSFVKIHTNRPRFFDRTDMWGQFFFKFVSFPHQDKEWWGERADLFKRHISHKTKLHGLAIVHCGVMCSFLHHRRNYAYVMLYEDLIGDVKLETTRLFNILNIDQVHLTMAMTALENDSQRGICGGIGNNNVSITQDTWQEIDGLMDKCGYIVNSRTTLDELRQILAPPNMP